MNHLLIVICLFFSLGALSQDQLETIDIQHYDIKIEVDDSHDTILVQESVTVRFKADCDSFYLDLVQLNPVSGKGMQIIVKIIEGKSQYAFNHRNDQLWIPSHTAKKGEQRTYSFQYKGIPETGLIIGKNKFGERTFFGDNWPNRARHWMACVDHPADKATIDYTVIAPKHYECIATGELQSSKKASDGKKIHSFSSQYQLPTKVMVIGLADFEIEKLENTYDFPITAWVYKDDADKGFSDMAVANKVTWYFISKIGAYPYEKLANVQSTTQFGGMENAGNIFYDENAVTGNGDMEALIAHEIAHQWFGNSASESDWKHLWLSEGFATYLTDLYWEETYGTDAMNERLIGERNRVLRFSKQYNHPVVDTTYTELMHLLNPHSYQKGAWVLHMLRNKVGDSIFGKGIRTYYDAYKYNNASTQDFQKIMEETSGINLDDFFNQWLFQSQHPTLKFKFNTMYKGDILAVYQLQNSHIFNFDLEVEVIYDDNTSEIVTFTIDEKNEAFELPTGKTISGLRYDPNVKLLFEEVEN